MSVEYIQLTEQDKMSELLNNLREPGTVGGPRYFTTQKINGFGMARCFDCGKLITVDATSCSCGNTLYQIAQNKTV